ncbi:MAG: DNA topoisomerase, partial [Chloroflexota bacterium]
QMAAALLDCTTVDIKADVPSTGSGQAPVSAYLLRVSTTIVTFPGFTVLYTEGRDEEEEGGNGKVPLPGLRQGDPLKLLELFTQQRFTQPPPRYTEATLVKALEQKGIGRPSTYAAIISVVQERDYVRKMQGRFHALELGLVVSDLLAHHFPVVADLGFTARMEEELDEIARGEKEWVSVLHKFYTPFDRALKEAHEKVSRVKFKEEPLDEVCPECGKPMVVKMGRFGKFVACTGYPACRVTRPYYVKLGVACPECGGDLVERASRKGRTFYACANYPRCRFASSRRPTTTPCPKCGGLLTMSGRGRVRCVKCHYAGPLTGEAADSVEAGAKESLVLTGARGDQ